MLNVNKKCELCSMQASHEQVDNNSIPHFFCEYHSLQDLKTSGAPKNTGNINKTNFSKFLPLYLVFLSIITLSLVRQFLFGPDFMVWMMDFMGVFFIIFGLFKLYDLKGFVEGFSTYDVIAKRWRSYGYVFPFLEILLGGMYLFGYMFLWQNLLALFISGLGIYSAYKVIRNKDEIQCVCLGTVFHLPMTNITLTENAVMFVMVLFMLVM